MPYAIIRTAKLSKMANISGSALHNFRERTTLNADPERTPSNETQGAQNTKQVLAKVRQRLATVPTVRKNAVLAIEYFIGASPEFFKDATIEQQTSYFDRAKTWLIKRHGIENIVSITRQYDETSPHICAYVVPIDPNGKLNCSHFLDGRTKLSEMQTDFANTCGRHVGLERGIEGSKAKHITLKNYYAQIQAGGLDNDDDDQREIERAKAKQYDIEMANKAATEARLSELRATSTQARNLSLTAVLEHLGGISEAKDKNNWRTPIGRITVDGIKFYAQDLGKGGGGAIDLVKLINETDFAGALSWLSRHFGTDAVVGQSVADFKEVVNVAAEITPKPYQAPEPKIENWPKVRQYLTEARKLSGQLVDKLHEMGKVYADQYSNAVFVLSKGVGVELRGTGDKPFHGVRGQKAAFIVTSSAEEKQIAFVESSIDAISLIELGFKGSVVSTSGNSAVTSKEVASLYRKQGFTVFAAFDNDRAGEQMVANLGQPTTRLCPKSKDWNDDLKARKESLKQSQQTTKIDRPRGPSMKF